MEQQPQAAPIEQVVVADNATREGAVIGRKRFLWQSSAGGVIGWGLGWFILIGAATSSSSSGWGVVLPLIVAGLCAGIIPSFAQWLLLRRVASAWKWIVASIVGLGVGGGLGIFIVSSIARSVGSMSPFVGMAIIGGMAGLGVGLGQWLVLRRRISNIPWWLAANVGALGLGLAIAFSIIYSWQGNQSLGMVIVLTLGCALENVVAGWLLPRLLKPVVE